MCVRTQTTTLFWFSSVISCNPEFSVYINIIHVFASQNTVVINKMSYDGLQATSGLFGDVRYCVSGTLEPRVSDTSDSSFVLNGDTILDISVVSAGI